MENNRAYEEQAKRWKAKFKHQIGCPELITAPTDAELAALEEAVANEAAVSKRKTKPQN